ncbi:uncharacterized protein LOC106057191 isoform X2 [Biomphalaria glabrata]|uniref:Uncharacterized protein LOC106057191 isoform X2 n=1 Tax=Biomphalaria glabrata TaxID=6526 RepID=A0A9U8E2A1_BIOGL|nr:uncharacterized protein LOC106057191 isoform X2 [Biomphalaria glabrata]
MVSPLFPLVCFFLLVSRGHCQTVNDTDSLNPATTTTASARPSTATPQQAMEDPCVLGLNACRHNAKNAEDSKDVEAYFTCVQAVHCNATEAGQMRKTEDLNDARKSLSQFSFNTSNIENEASSILFLNGFLLVVSIVSFISF